MGLTVAELRTLFTGDTRDIDRAQDRIRKDTRQTQGVLKTATGTMAGFLGANLATSAVRGLVGVAMNATRLEQTYSKTMATMQAATGATGKEIEDLDSLAMKLGADTQFSAGDAAGAMLELAKAGISTSDIMGGALQGTLLLASAGSTDLATASTIASNALNIFGLQGKDMARVAAALAGGANASSASVESLGQALGQVGPGAVNAGLSLEQTIGTLSAFDAAGIKGSDAGTSLKTMLVSLVPSTKASAKAMRENNLEFTNADGSFKSIIDIAGQLKTNLAGLSDAQRTQTLATIFGSDASRAASVLMKLGSKGLREYVTATKDQTAAQKMADAAMSGTSGAAEKLSGAVETAQLAIGKALAPTIEKTANMLADDAVPAVTGFIEGMQDGTGAGGDFADVLGDVVDVGQAALDLFNAIPGPVKKYGAELLIAAKAMSYLGSATSGIGASVGGGMAGLKQFRAELSYTETRGAALSRTLSGISPLLRNVAGAGGMMLVADSANRTSGELGVLEAAAGGALSGAALGGFGGPWGMAIGGVIGGVGGAFLGLSRDTDEAGDAAKRTMAVWSDYKDTLEGLQAVTTKATRSRVIDDLASDQNKKVIEGLGISTTVWTNAILGNAKAQERITAAIQASKDIYNERIAAQQAVVDAAIAADKQLSDAFQNGDATADQLRDSNKILEAEKARLATLLESAQANVLTADAQQRLLFSLQGQTAEQRKKNAELLTQKELVKLGVPKKVASFIDREGVRQDVAAVAGLISKFKVVDETKWEAILIASGLPPTKDNLEQIKDLLKDIGKTPVKPKVDDSSIKAAQKSLNTFLQSMGLANLNVPFSGGRGSGTATKDDKSPRMGGPLGRMAAGVAQNTLDGFKTEGSRLEILEQRKEVRDLERQLADPKLDMLEQRRTIRDLKRDLAERKKIKNKKGKGYHLGGLVLTGIDREIAIAQLAEARKDLADMKTGSDAAITKARLEEARKELQRLMGKYVDDDAVSAYTSAKDAIADQLKQSQGLFSTGATTAAQGLKNLLTDQVTNNQWLALLAGLQAGGASQQLLDEFKRNGPSSQSLALGNSILKNGMVGQYNQALGTLNQQQNNIGAAGASGVYTAPKAMVNIETYNAAGQSEQEIARRLYFQSQVQG